MIRDLFRSNVIIYNITQMVSTVTRENMEILSTGTPIMARLRPLTKTEIFRANKNNVIATHKMYCDYSTFFSEKDRVYFNNKYYEITGIKNPQMLDRFLEVNLNRGE